MNFIAICANRNSVYTYDSHCFDWDILVLYCFSDWKQCFLYWDFILYLLRSFNNLWSIMQNENSGTLIKLLISRQWQQSIIPTMGLLCRYNSRRSTFMNRPCGLQFILRGVTRTCHIHAKSISSSSSMADIYWKPNLKDSWLLKKT